MTMTQRCLFWIEVSLAALVLVLLLEPQMADACRRRPLRRNAVVPFVIPCPPVGDAPVTPVPQPPEPKEIPLPALDKDLRVNVKNLADLFRKGNRDSATRFAAMIAGTVEEQSDLEHLYRPRRNGGLGWGATPVLPDANDGLERGLPILLNMSPQAAVARKIANEEAAYELAAMAEVTFARVNKMGRKNPELWLDPAKRLRDASLELAYPAAMGDVNAMKEIIPRITSACQTCHVKFK